MSDIKDYAVKIKVQNNRMLSYMRAMGYKNANQLSKACGVGPNEIGLLLNFKKTALTKGEAWRISVLRICEVLKCLPEDIIPEQHLRNTMEKNNAEIALDADQIKLIALDKTFALPDNSIEKQQAIETIHRALATLPKRYRTVIERRWLSDAPITLREVGEELGVSHERARQMELIAMRKLKWDFGKLENPTTPLKNPLRELLRDRELWN